jgi:hypothetical protein
MKVFAEDPAPGMVHSPGKGLSGSLGVNNVVRELLDTAPRFPRADLYIGNSPKWTKESVTAYGSLIKLATSFLAIYIGLLTRFSVPLDLSGHP